MKFQNSFFKKIEAFMAEMDESNFWKHCSIHHIACLLGVHRTTVWRWVKDGEEAGDTNKNKFATLIKKWEEKRNALFLELKRKDSAWIFLAKNWLEMSDRQEVKHSGEVKTSLSIEDLRKSLNQYSDADKQ